jgi:hypothetical protein
LNLGSTYSFKIRVRIQGLKIGPSIGSALCVKY